MQSDRGQHTISIDFRHDDIGTVRTCARAAPQVFGVAVLHGCCSTETALGIAGEWSIKTLNVWPVSTNDWIEVTLVA